MVEIDTQRLLIRNFVLGDWQALHEMIVQYEASPYAVYDYAWPTSREEIKKVAVWFAGGDRYLAVCLKEGERLIGFIALNPQGDEEDHAYNLGYCFNFDYHGRGYAGEACRAVLAHAFGRLRAQRVVTGTAAANEPSCRLLQRLGFSKTGESVGSFRKTADGKPIEFTGFNFTLEREVYERRSSPWPP